MMEIPEFLEAIKKNRFHVDIRYSEAYHSYSFIFSREVLNTWKFWECMIPEDYIWQEGVFATLLDDAMEHLSDEAIIAEEREKLNRMLAWNRSVSDG